MKTSDTFEIINKGTNYKLTVPRQLDQIPILNRITHMPEEILEYMYTE